MKHNQEVLIKEAKEAITERGHASTSLLQRRLRLSYSVAYDLIELLIEEGFIGERDGAKPMKIL